MDKEGEKEKDELPITDQIAWLYQELAIAEICYEMYKNITFDSSPLSGKNFNIIDANFPSLIRAERRIFFSTLIIQLYKFIDKHPKAISLKKLLDRCNDNQLYQTIDVQYQTLIATYQEPIRKIRHQASAHTDIHTKPDDLLKSIVPPLSYESLKQALSDIKRILDFITSCLNDGMKGNFIKSEDVGGEQISLFETAANKLDE